MSGVKGAGSQGVPVRSSAELAAEKAAHARFREVSAIKEPKVEAAKDGFKVDNARKEFAAMTGASGRMAGVNRFASSAPVSEKRAVRGDTARVHAALEFLSAANPTIEHGNFLK